MMELANFLAEVWGLSIVVLCLSFLVKPKNLKTIFRFIDDEKMLLLIAIINLVLGFALVLTYSVVSLSWTLAVTVLNWIVVLRAVVILFFPEKIVKIAAKLKARTDLWSVFSIVGIILGCLLVYLGFAF